jgi:hypothetical protein
MSLDRQEYQELRKKSRLLGLLGIGDFGYYLDILGSSQVHSVGSANGKMQRYPIVSINRPVTSGIVGFRGL